MPRFVSAKRCLVSNLHSLTHPGEARAVGPRRNRVCHARHAVAGRGGRGEQVVDVGLGLHPVKALSDEICFRQALSVFKPALPHASWQKIAPKDHDAIACAMLAMQLLAEEGVGTKLLTGASDCISPAF